MQAPNPLNALAKAMNIPVRLCRASEQGDLDLNSMHKYLLNPCWGRVDFVNDDPSAELYDPTDSGGKVLIKNLTGQTLIIRVPSFRLTVFDLKEMIAELEKGHNPDQLRLIFKGKGMEDLKSLAFYGMGPDSTVHMITRLLGGGPGWSLDASVLSPNFNFDYTNIVDRTVYERGGLQYIRPCGWQRYALNVDTRYGCKTWLEGSKKRGSQSQSAPDEWPVSYHGTSKHNGHSIAQEGFKLGKGFRFTFGRGIYSSPDPNVAMKYAQKYVHDGCTYLMILQNRVNPLSLIKVTNEQTGNKGEYWIVPNEEDIRPYVFCLKKFDNIRVRRAKIMHDV